MTPTTVGLEPSADVARVQRLLREFAEISDPAGRPGVTRLAYTQLERQAHAMFAEFMEQLGLSVWTDAAGNTFAERAGDVPGLPALGTGSHLDSVPNAGRFDGVAGVVAAMETARLLVETGRLLAHPVRFAVFAAEEGARFGQACTGSRIVAGLTTPDDLESKRDTDGVTLADAMRAVGVEPTDVGRARWKPRDWSAFIELHIEQGNVLESAGIPAGVVDLISGSTRMLFEVAGRAAHTGGSPMHLRADALAAAAEVVLLVESVANDARHRGARATVGKLEVEPGSITTIAGRSTLHVDVRDVDTDRQRLTAAEIVERATALCAHRGTRLTAELLADASPVQLPRWLRDTIAGSCDELGVQYRVLPSGASHDAQMVNHVVPTGMIFVPSRDGISHSPEEWTDVQDIATGIDVLVVTLTRLDSTLRKGSGEEPR